MTDLLIEFCQVDCCQGLNNYQHYVLQSINKFGTFDNYTNLIFPEKVICQNLSEDMIILKFSIIMKILVFCRIRQMLSYNSIVLVKYQNLVINLKGSSLV